MNVKHISYSSKKRCQCYQQRSGVVISTSSSDYPHIVFSGRNLPLCLFPQSLYFVEHRSELSKAQKAKFSSLLTTGEQIDYIANKYNIVVDYTRLSQQNRQVRYTDKILLEDFVIISPEIPRRCWSTWLSGFVSAPLNLLSGAIPNIAYHAYLAIDSYLTDPEKDEAFPRPNVTFDLGSIIKPVSSNFYVDDIYHAQWNLPDNRGLFQDFFNVFDSTDIVQLSRERLPKPPREKVTSAIIYVLDNQDLLWPNRPMHKIVLGVLPTENEKKLLNEGCAIRADMFYCKFNNFYVIYRYVVTEKDVRYPWLVTCQRVDVAEFGGHTEYYIELTYSNYKGFFVGKELKNCLIDDPKHILLASMQDERKIIFFAWIRLNKFGRPARFSIASLFDETPSKTIKNDIDSNVPNIAATGFLVNVSTGSVFCESFPTLRILLMISDRVQLQAGEYIQFDATFLPLMNAFVIFNYNPVKRMFPRVGIPSNKGFLFEDSLNCTTVKSCMNLYEGKNFGLVTDLEEIIKTKAVVENIEMPESVKVYLEENLDKNRSTFFNVYALYFDLSRKDLEVDNLILCCSPTNDWWKSTNQQECNCKEIKNLCEELLEMMNCIDADYYGNELNYLFHKLRSVC